MTAPRSNPGFYWFRHGDFDCAVISDGQLTIPMPGSYGASDAEVNAILDEHFMSHEEMPLDQNALYVDTGRNRVLIDTGMGAVKWFGPETGKLMQNLRAAGIDPDTIDTVLLTHGHPDHCFGLRTAEGTRAFPNADVHISDAEFLFWTGQVPADPEAAPADWVSEATTCLSLYGNRLHRFTPGDEIVPGIRAVDCAGHSVGLVAFELMSQGRAFLNVGDAFHHSIVEPMRPDWVFTWDMDPPGGVVAKKRLFESLAAQEAEFLAFHFPWPGLGRLRSNDGGYRFVPSPICL